MIYDDSCILANNLMDIENLKTSSRHKRNCSDPTSNFMLNISGVDEEEYDRNFEIFEFPQKVLEVMNDSF